MKEEEVLEQDINAILIDLQIKPKLDIGVADSGNQEEQ